MIVAHLLGVTERTVGRWKAQETGRPRGRPATPYAARLAAARRVVAEWRHQGRSAGWRPVAAALPELPTRLVQEEVAAAKKRLRAAKALRRELRLRGIDVLGRDVLWSLDATHLGRGEDGIPVEAQAVREVATTRSLALTVGPPVTTDDAIEVVAAAAALRGGKYPLVLATDNGPAYTSVRFERFIAASGVLHLLNLPHTPRHNPWVERGNRDFKEETGLGKGVVVPDVEWARRRLERAVERLDGNRLRRRLGYQTARAVDATLAVPYDDNVRARLADAVRRRVEDGLRDPCSAREERVLRREAILAALEELGLIERTRGGRSLNAVKPDRIS